MKTVYLYLIDTIADWEVGNITAELKSKRFLKSECEVELKTVTLSKKTVCTMGGLKVLPDCTLDEIEISNENFLILPGSNTWNNQEHEQILEVAVKFLTVGAGVSAICGTTVALAGKTY